MKHIVYYFSGTGNSLKVAKELEKQGANVRSIANELQMSEQEGESSIKCDAEKVGFVFPLYFLGLPKMFHEFIDKLELSNATYVYMVCTMGWSIKGGAIRQMKQHLVKKDIHLNMGCYIHMPMNDFTLCTVAEPAKQKKVLAAFDTKMSKIFNLVEQSKAHFDTEPMKVLVEKRNAPFCKEVAKKDQYFTTTDACTGCGICAKVCSSNNIVMKNGKPEWNHNCQSCLGCFHYCPKHAIRYKGKGEEIPQYHHPDISMKEISK